MLGGQPGAAAIDEFLPRHADEIGHLQGRPAHLGVAPVWDRAFPPRSRAASGF